MRRAHAFPVSDLRVLASGGSWCSVLCIPGRGSVRGLWSRGVAVLAATTAVCGAVSAGLTAAAARRVGVAAPPAAAAWVACATAVWACGASRVGVTDALPLLPAAIVAAPLVVTDWRVRRLPDGFTLPAGSATAAALVVVAAAESSSWVPWLVAGPVVALASAGHILAARGSVSQWCVVGSVWAVTAAGCVTSGSGRLTASVAGGALITGLILIAHLAGAAGFGDVKIAPMVCCAAWAAWDPAGAIWVSSAAAFLALWLSVTLGGLAAAVSSRVRTDGVPLGAFLPGSALVVAVAATWL